MCGKYADIFPSPDLTKQLWSGILAPMKARDVVIGLVVLIALIAGALYLKNRKAAPLTSTPTPNYQNVESKFPGLNVPANADRASLTDVSGGQGMGEAFRTFQNGKFSLTVIVNLPSPKAGYFYQSWMVQGDSYLSLGKMAVSKGGYISEFGSAKDYTGYTKIVVTQEKVLNSTPETHILEGSF